MLAIMRKPGESFTIGDHIEIYIDRVRGDKVHLGIEAPKELKILRDNAINRTKKSNITGQDKALLESNLSGPV